MVWTGVCAYVTMMGVRCVFLVQAGVACNFSLGLGCMIINAILLAMQLTYFVSRIDMNKRYGRHKATFYQDTELVISIVSLILGALLS